MLKRLPWEWMTLFATLALLAISSAIPFYSMWGINHLAFLPGGWWWIFGIAAVTVVIVSLSGESAPRLDRLFGKMGDMLFERGIWPKIACAMVCGGLFFLFRIRVQLLGDGYTWLAVFSSGEYYISKWTEVGGIALLRALQALLGGYTTRTALVSFQILSIASGCLFVFLSLEMIRTLAHNASLRALALTLLVGSGAVLMFFGYVEFYAPLWAAAMAFLFTSIRAVNDRRWFPAALVSFVLGAVLHLAMIVLFPALLFLLIQHLPFVRRSARPVIVLALMTVLAIAGWLITIRRPDVALLILPFFAGRGAAPDYTAFSLIHFTDLLNLVMIVGPLVPATLVLLATRGQRFRFEPVDTFLAFGSLGSLAFCFFYGAAITMARDWDVMAFGLLVPLIWLIRLVSAGSPPLSSRLAAAFGVIGLTFTACYIGVCVSETPAEKRFETLLNERSRNGYVILSNYYSSRGDDTKAEEVVVEMRRRFPDYSRLRDAYTKLNGGHVDDALEIARLLVQKDTLQADFLQILATALARKGQLDSADYYYRKSLTYNPYNNLVLNEYGQLLMSQGAYDSAVVVLRRANTLPPPRSFVRESLALAYIYLNDYRAAEAMADTLFKSDLNSPGAHLILLTIAARTGELDTARVHLRAFEQYGRRRSDWLSIKEHYKYLQ